MSSSLTSSDSLVHFLSNHRANIPWASIACNLFKLSSELNKASNNDDRGENWTDLVRILTVDLLQHITVTNGRQPDYFDRLHSLLAAAPAASVGAPSVAIRLQALCVEFGMLFPVLCKASLADAENRLHLLESQLDALLDSNLRPHVSLSALRDCTALYYSMNLALDESGRRQFHAQLTSADAKISRLTDRLSIAVLGSSPMSSRSSAHEPRSDNSSESNGIALTYLATQHALLSRRNFVKALVERSNVRYADDVIHDHVILPGTRTWLLERFSHWTETESTHQPFYALFGRSGTGKTAMSATFCKLFRKNVVARYFFKSNPALRSQSESDVKSLLYGISYCFLHNLPEYLGFLDEQLTGSDVIARFESSSWQSLYQWLIRDPVWTLYGKPASSGSTSDRSSMSISRVIVVDAADECRTSEWNQLKMLLDFFRADLTHAFKLFVTCRSKNATDLIPFGSPDGGGGGGGKTVCLDGRASISSHVNDIEIYLAAAMGAALQSGTTAADSSGSPSSSSSQLNRAKSDETTLQSALDEMLKASGGRFDWAVELARLFTSGVTSSKQFLTSLKKSIQALEASHAEYQRKTGDFQSTFRAYRNQQGRTVGVNVTRPSLYVVVG